MFDYSALDPPSGAKSNDAMNAAKNQEQNRNISRYWETGDGKTAHATILFSAKSVGSVKRSRRAGLRRVVGARKSLRRARRARILPRLQSSPTRDRRG